LATALFSCKGMVTIIFLISMQLRHRQASTVARPVAAAGPRAGERPVEKPVEFVLKHPRAQSVTVAGSFNGWDVKRTPMRLGSGGAWRATVWLPAGSYEYRFVVDGQWISDPGARESVQNTFGSTNSVLVV
jgi:1,4-alpha-glucan branching enzyme